MSDDARLVLQEAAWQLKLEGLMKLRNDASIFRIMKTELREEFTDGEARGVVWYETCNSMCSVCLKKRAEHGLSKQL